MAFKDFMAKVRYWDNRSAKWIMRHFYILFFEFFLVFIFLIFFVNVIQVINISGDIQKNNILERLIFSQNVSTLIVVILLLMNSFWMLYMFNSIIRFRAILKDISFTLNRQQRRPNPPNQSQH